MRAWLLVCGLLILGGCVAPYAAVEVGSVMATRKMLVDHVATLVTGKDCSTMRLSEGGAYCTEEKPQALPSPAHCYRTIADVDCYARPVADPGYQPVDAVQPPAVPRQ